MEETRQRIRETMRDRLEYRGYTVTNEKLDELLDIYEDCQEWDAADNMITGTTYDEIDEFIKRNYAVDEIFG